MKELLLMFALLLPGLAAWPWLRGLATLPPWLRMNLILPLGYSFLLAGQSLAAACGLCGLASGCLSLALTFVAGWRFSSRWSGGSPPSASEAQRPAISWRMGILTALALAAVLAAWWPQARQALEAQSTCIPGLGVWGIKAKVLLEQGTLPAQILCAPDFGPSHPEYPPGWPLFLHWCAVWLGGWDGAWLNLIPTLLALGVAFFIASAAIQDARRGWALPAAIILAGVVLGGEVAAQVATQLYAENLLLLFLLPALALAWRVPQESVPGPWLALAACSGAACLVKQEGLLVSVLLWGWLGIACRYEGVAGNFRRWGWSVGGVALIFVLPWQACKSAMGLTSHDFAAGAAELAKCAKAFAEVARLLAHGGWDGLGTLAALAVACCAAAAGRGALWRQRLWLFALLAGLPTLFCAAFAFSVRDLAWHVEALDRLLHLGLILSLGAALSLRRRLSP